MKKIEGHGSHDWLPDPASIVRSHLKVHLQLFSRARSPNNPLALAPQPPTPSSSNTQFPLPSFLCPKPPQASAAGQQVPSSAAETLVRLAYNHHHHQQQHTVLSFRLKSSEKFFMQALNPISVSTLLV